MAQMAVRSLHLMVLRLHRVPRPPPPAPTRPHARTEHPRVFALRCPVASPAASTGPGSGSRTPAAAWGALHWWPDIAQPSAGRGRSMYGEWRPEGVGGLPWRGSTRAQPDDESRCQNGVLCVVCVYVCICVCICVYLCLCVSSSLHRARLCIGTPQGRAGTAQRWAWLACQSIPQPSAPLILPLPPFPTLYLGGPLCL